VGQLGATLLVEELVGCLGSRRSAAGVAVLPWSPNKIVWQTVVQLGTCMVDNGNPDRLEYVLYLVGVTYGE